MRGRICDERVTKGQNRKGMRLTERMDHNAYHAEFITKILNEGTNIFTFKEKYINAMFSKKLNICIYFFFNAQPSYIYTIQGRGNFRIHTRQSITNEQVRTNSLKNSGSCHFYRESVLK